MWRLSFDVVIAGFDPAIHSVTMLQSSRTEDGVVEPCHDDMTVGADRRTG